MIPQVVIVVVLLAAPLAPRLVAITAFVLVEFRVRFGLAALRATFQNALAHSFDINIDIDMTLQRRHFRDEFVTMPA